MKRPIIATVTLLSLALNVMSRTIILQQGLDNYSGCTDRAVVDTYNFMKTAWWLSEEAFTQSMDHSSPERPSFAVAYFEC